jgi:hypothetical protein
MATKKITLNELRSLVKQIIKEDVNKDVYHKAIEYILGREIFVYHDEANNYAYKENNNSNWFTIPRDVVDYVVKHHKNSLMK